MFVIFICYETNDISYRLLKKKKSFVPPNTKKKKLPTQPEFHPASFTISIMENIVRREYNMRTT